MTNPYDPFDPWRRGQQTPRSSARSAGRTPGWSNAQRAPTVDDFQKLLQAYRELETSQEKLSKQVATLQRELQIKSEALAKQGEAMRQDQSELVWMRAALQQAQQGNLSDAAVEPEEATWQERYQRLQAELENLRRRWEQRHEKDVAEARNRILLDMLPLADHLDLALQHAASLPESDRDFVANIEATRQAFLDTLRRYGVERVAADGVAFDPSQHEAVGYVEQAETPADHVAQVVQAGYADGERLLRPARVLLSSGAKTS